MSKKKKNTIPEPQWLQNLENKWAEYKKTPFMSKVLGVLDKIKNAANKVRAFVLVWYKKLRPIILFIVKFFCFWIIFSYFGNQTLINIALAVVCALLPLRFGVLAAVGVSIWQACSVSLLGGIIFGVFVLLIYVTVARLVPEYGYLLLLIPVCLQFKLYLLVPVFVGLFANPVAIIAIIGGVLMWIMFQVEPVALTYTLDLKSLSLDTLPQALVDAVEGTFGAIVDRFNLVILAFVLAAVCFLVFLMKKIQVKHNRALAIWTGTFFGVLALIITSAVFGAVDTAWNFIWISFVTALAALLVQWLDLPLDYQSAERVDFSDEEYYYQVIVTPKDPSVKADMARFDIGHGNKGEVIVVEDPTSTTVLSQGEVAKLNETGAMDQATGTFTLDEDDEDEDETWESQPERKSVVSGDLGELFAKKK